MALWIIVITVMICFYPFEDRDKFGIVSQLILFIYKLLIFTVFLWCNFNWLIISDASVLLNYFCKSFFDECKYSIPDSMWQDLI